MYIITSYLNTLSQFLILTFTFTLTIFHPEHLDYKISAQFLLLSFKEISQDMSSLADTSLIVHCTKQFLYVQSRILCTFLLRWPFSSFYQLFFLPLDLLNPCVLRRTNGTYQLTFQGFYKAPFPLLQVFQEFLGGRHWIVSNSTNKRSQLFLL